MGREFELKYRASQEQLEAMKTVYGGGKTIAMETTYYDNPDGEFAKRRWTLRRRLENGVSVCTLKTTLPDGGRGEWEIESDDLLRAIPRLIELGAPEEIAGLTAGGIVPTCGARFTRHAITLPSGGGTVELALDEGVLLGGGKEETLREAEVELKSGEDDDAIGFAQALAQRFSLTPEPKSKLARARALAKMNE